MSIEERINLIGEILEEVSSSGATSITLSYKNITEYILKIAIQENCIIELYDENANYNDFHWQLKSTINSEEKIIGYGGSNNKQYDHRTWDTINSIRYINLNPNDEVEVTLSASEVNGSSSGDYLKSKGIGIRLVVAGVLEI